MAAALAVSALAATDTTGTFPLKGKVVDGLGKPVAGAVVERYQYDRSQPQGPTEMKMQQSATTDADGNFELLAARTSRTSTLLLARKSGLALAWKQFIPTPTRADASLVLTPSAVLAGTLVDEADKPVAGAEVFVAMACSETTTEGGGRSYNYLSGKLARQCYTARTAADGRFRMENFPTNAACELAARASGKVLRPTTREYRGPDSMQCRAGQEDIRLVAEPAGSIEGKIVAEETGASLPVAQLWLQADGPGSYVAAFFEPVQSAADGTFRIGDVAAGSYRLRAVFGTNQPHEWVADTVPVSVEAGQATRDVKITAVRGGFLEVATVEKKDRKPLEQVSISAYRQSFSGGGVSGRNGLALLRLLPGDYQVNAFKENWRAENSSATVEAGKTNRLEIEVASPPKLSGVVRRPDGQPATNLPVRIIGDYSSSEGATTTDADGKFETEWNPQRYGSSGRTFCLLIRDAERNLAVAQDVDEDTGPLDLKLSPGLTIAGRAECDGKPLTNTSAALVFWTGNSGMHLNGLSTGTNVPGRFEIPALPLDRRYGLYVSAPGYGTKYVSEVDSSEARRVEIDLVELAPANLKLAGQVLDQDEKPVANVYVSLSGDGQPSSNARTDREGRFTFERVCAGTARLYASAQNSYGNITAEGGETNVVLRLGQTYSGGSSSKRQKVKGTVTGPDGKPAAGVAVEVFPSGSASRVKTGPNGAFNLTYTIESWRSSESSRLVVRDLARNLAAAEELSEETTNLTVQLKPALTLAGRVEGTNGAPLTNAEVGVWLSAGRTSSQIGEQLARADARGRFEIKGLPVGEDYRVFAKAKDYGQSQQKVQENADTNRVELDPFVLKLADKVLAGQVVNSDDKPQSGVHVGVSGNDQPSISATTDSKGRFKLQVCEGTVQFYASSQNGYANGTAEAGDTNVVIQLAPSGSASRSVVRRASLKGKPLPDLTALGFAAADMPAGKPLVLCLLDIEQRPSRRVARLLAEQHDALRQKGVTVLAAQASVTTADSLKEWKEASPVPFSVGRVADKSEKVRWASGVESLPWLILSDAQGKVAAEGFPFDELEAQLKALPK
ncbi:MAG: carboxypeptidase regulatory-like domain-containing protein [Verrucomicrobia bacterium]|nr:carboxypeptidase regulatory-like domain-containing protein [Verrucomicrobiota bacterium]